MAEVLMKDALRRARVKRVSVSSAGTATAGGVPVSEGAMAAVREMGLTLGGKRSRPLTDLRVTRADLILTMTQAHRDQLVERWPEAEEKVFLISEFSGSERRGITDPVGGSHELYLATARDLEDEIKRIVPRVKRVLKTRRK
jgi:protein-tyrosine-phosphatase